MIMKLFFQVQVRVRSVDEQVDGEHDQAVRHGGKPEQFFVVIASQILGRGVGSFQEVNRGRMQKGDPALGKVCRYKSVTKFSGKLRQFNHKSI